MTSANPVALPIKTYAAQHVLLAVADAVAVITLNRPERKNPLTFESYAELGNIFRATARDKSVKAIVVTGAGGNFCSGGDVFEIIKPLTEMNASGLLDFTRMTGELVKAMRAAPQPIIAAIDGVCAGAGAIMAMASDIRIGTSTAKVAFLFNRVGLGGCDMGACAILPRIVGQGRAAELLFTGRSLSELQATAKLCNRRYSSKRNQLGRPTVNHCSAHGTWSHANLSVSNNPPLSRRPTSVACRSVSGCRNGLTKTSSFPHCPGHQPGPTLIRRYWKAVL